MMRDSRIKLDLEAQFATSSWGGRRTHPFAFTEQGGWFAFSKMDIGVVEMLKKVKI
jgi:hypothetical protein